MFEIQKLGGLSKLGQQAYEYEQFATHEPSGTRVRVFAHVDTSYEQQAYAKIEAWTPNGWSFITSLPTDIWYEAMPYSRGADRAQTRIDALEALEQVRTLLLEKAKYVLGE